MPRVESYYIKRNVIEKWMAEMNLSQTKAAEFLNIQQSTFSTYVRGKSKMSAHILDHICKKTGLTRLSLVHE